MLEDERDKTLDEQQKREQVRLMREKMIADRVFAAKNRQRARLGLPALSRDEFEAAEKKPDAEADLDPKQKKKEEKKQKKKEKQEKVRDEKRQQHIRPWDQGKDGIVAGRSSAFDEEKSDDEKWEYKAEKPEPMSQEQWNERQRAGRNPDFAPPSFETSFNRFTTKKPKPLKRRNETACENMFNEPIRNELDGNDFPPDENDTNKRRRAEIAPPPTFDYYGPASGSKPKHKTENANISDSIEAGLRFLREKSDKSGPGATKQSWVANTAYEE